MNGLYLPQPHADMIASGKKHYIAQGADNPELCGEYLLVTGGSSDGKVLGRVNVSAGEPISPSDFDGRYREHRVPAYNRKAWWPDVQTLYLHKIEQFEACDEVSIEVRPGVQTLMGEIGLTWEDVKEAKMPYSMDNVPRPSKNWPDADKRKCVAAANAVLKADGTEQEAIFACIRAAGRTKNPGGEDKKELEVNETDYAIAEGIVTGLKGPEPELVIVSDERETKAVNISQEEREIRDAFYSRFKQDTMQPQVAASYDDLYIYETWDEFLIVEKGSDYFKVPYTKDNDLVVFATIDAWIPVEKTWAVTMKEKKESDTKVGRRVRGDKVELLNQLKTIMETLWKWATNQDRGTVSPEEDMEDDDDKKDYAVKVVGDYLILWPTNAFQDRELEIFTTKSIEDYVERHKPDAVKGRAMYRHWKGTDFGDIVYQDTFGRYLVEVAKFDDTPLGNAFKALFAKYPNGHPDVSPEGWGYSHGYKYNPADRQDRVYEWFDKDETSVLPASVASNPHNPTKVEVITMSQKSIQELSALIGEDLANDVAKKGESLTEEKEKAGVAFKEAKPEAAPEEAVVEEVAAPEAEPEVEAPSEEVAPNTAEPESVEPEAEKVDAGQVDVEQVVEAVTKALDVKALSDTLAAQAQAITELKTLVTDFKSRIEEIERSDEVRLEQKAKEMPRFFWQAVPPSQSHDNKVKDDDPIKAKVPVETPPAIENLADRLG